MNHMYNAGGGNLSIAPGTDVFDVNGDKVGSVERFEPQANYFVVEKGMLFKKDLFIPTSAIGSIAADGVRLTLSKDDLKDTMYTSPPAAGMTGGMVGGTAGTYGRDDDILSGGTGNVDDQGYPLDRSTNRDPDLNP